MQRWRCCLCLFFFQAEDGIRDYKVTGVQTCALPIWERSCISRGGGEVRLPEHTLGGAPQGCARRKNKDAVVRRRRDVQVTAAIYGKPAGHRNSRVGRLLRRATRSEVALPPYRSRRGIPARRSQGCRKP